MTSYLFKKGDRVRYIPHHANGDEEHPDCENGVVSSTNDHVVFVKYDIYDIKGYHIMITGDEPYTAKATDPADLIKL